MERGAKLNKSFSQWSWSSRKQRSLLKASADSGQTRITGGAENESACDTDDNYFHNDSDEEDETMRQTLYQQNHKTLNHLLCRKHALMMQHKLLMI